MQLNGDDKATYLIAFPEEWKIRTLVRHGFVSDGGKAGTQLRIRQFLNELEKNCTPTSPQMKTSPH